MRYTEALCQLGWLTEGEAAELADFRRPIIRNWQGTPVGEMIPTFQL